MTESTDALQPQSEITRDPVPASTGGMLARLMAFIQTNKEFERFWKFAVVGGIGFVIDFGVSNISWLVIPETFSIPLPFGKAISYIGLGGTAGFLTAITSNFIWNRYWTYPDSRSKPLAQQFLIFVAINVAGIVIRIPILEILSHQFATWLTELLPGLGVTYFAFLGAEGPIWLGKNLALAVSVILVMFWNFFVNRYITYNDVD